MIILLPQNDDVYVRIFAADLLLALNRPRLGEVWKQVLSNESTYIIEIANKALQDLQNSQKLSEVS